MFNRIKQFFIGIKAIFNKTDYNYVEKYLNKEELIIFNKLSKLDKEHSIRVSKYNLKILINKKNKYDYKLYEKELAKLGLLHDIGKLEKPLNLIDKSLLVVLDKITNGNLNKYDDIKKIDIYYNHPKKGAKILEKYNYSDDFIDAIKNHHNNIENHENMLLNILKKSDDIN